MEAESESDTLNTPAEVAERLKCSSQNVYALIEQKKLGSFRIGANGSGIRVSERQLQAFLEERREHPGKDAHPLRPKCNPIKLKHLK